MYQCTKHGCEEGFIGSYTQSASNLPHVLRKVAPMTAKHAEFSEVIRGVSSLFCDIYNQAMTAEAYGLTELTGIGLRKALEYLVKDFAIKQVPENEEEVKRAFLGRCIEHYIADENVKICAKRAAWLGNDEAHYTRKWEDKDVTDLKLLIKLTINWIENVLLTKKYADEMRE